MRKYTFLFALILGFYSNAQFQMECKITQKEGITTYRTSISPEAARTTFNAEGMEMIMLIIANKGTYTIMPAENMAIKMNDKTIDTISVCECSFVKTGKKQTILGYETDEYIQTCLHRGESSTTHTWIAPKLTINPTLISPLKGLNAESKNRPAGFPMLNEGTLSNGDKIKFEVTSIMSIKPNPNDYIIPSNYVIIEY